MNGLASRARTELGIVGIAALVLLGAALAAHIWLVRPQELRLAALNAEIAARGPGPIGADRPLTAAAKIAVFYEFFRSEDPDTDWLARLYGTALAHGVEFRAADYRYVDSEGRLLRYQISLPLTGSYPRIRAFLEGALVEIPALSLDQAVFRRQRATDAGIEANVTFTLHVLRP